MAGDEGGRPYESDESHKERIDRELNELLSELRVAIPGAEVLFAFLLGVAFTARFETASSLQRGVYFTVLLTTAAATALLIAPTAYHRLHFRDSPEDKERMLFSVGRMAVASLVLVAVSISGVIFLVADVLYSTPAAAIAGAGASLWFAWFWFGLPMLRRRTPA